MKFTRQISVTLRLELARMAKLKVEAGGYASESEVIREVMPALQERDAVVEADYPRPSRPPERTSLADFRDQQKPDARQPERSPEAPRGRCRRRIERDR